MDEEDDLNDDWLKKFKIEEDGLWVWKGKYKRWMLKEFKRIGIVNEYKIDFYTLNSN